jgi:O-antigen/teichoic acid export membrane protein
MVIADPGMGAAVVRFAGRGRAEAAAVLRESAVLQLFASVTAFAVFAAPALLIAPPRTSVDETLLPLGLFTIVEGFSVVGAAVVRVTERDRLFLVLSGLRIVTAIGAGTLGAYYGGAAGALYGVAVAGIGFAVVGVSAFRGVSPTRDRARGIRRMLLGYGLPLISTSLMTWALSLSDRIFLRVFSSAVVLGRYSASYRLGGVIAIFVAGPIAIVWVPVARRLRSKAERIRTSERWAARTTLVALGLGILLVSASHELVPAVFGRPFASDAAVVAAVVVSGWLFGLYFLCATEILLSESTRVLIVVAAVAIGFNFVANAILISIWSAHGAAAATALSYLVLCIATFVAQQERPVWILGRHLVVLSAVLLGLLAVAVVHPLIALIGLAVGVVAYVWLTREHA